MRDCAVEPPACVPEGNPVVNYWHGTGDCGSSSAAGLFFFGFFVMVFCKYPLPFVVVHVFSHPSAHAVTLT